MISHRKIVLGAIALGLLSGCAVESGQTITGPSMVNPRYLVFFEWGDDHINPQNMDIISRAATYATDQKWRYPKLVVSGYADRSGPRAANMRLSKKRAEKVMDALTRLGVPHGNIAVTWRGERDNRVPTADGVREPQNRRVEIVFP